MKNFFTTTRGRIRVNRLLLVTSVSLSVLSIGLQTCGRANSISDESIFGNSESLEIRIGESSLRATGSDTTGALMNLIKKEFLLETINSEEKLFQYNPQKEKLILKRRGNSFSTVS